MKRFAELELAETGAKPDPLTRSADLLDALDRVFDCLLVPLSRRIGVLHDRNARRPSR
jgi:hypothetical protein